LVEDQLLFSGRVSLEAIKTACELFGIDEILETVFKIKIIQDILLPENKELSESEFLNKWLEVQI